MVVYLGSATEVPLREWDDAKPSLHVTKIVATGLEVVRRRLGSAFVHYVGSGTQCGCGFRQESALYVDWAEADLDDMRDNALNHAALAEYLRALPKTAYPLRLYSCWSGEEGERCAFEVECGIGDLEGEDFVFRERQLTVIQSNQG